MANWYNRGKVALAQAELNWPSASNGIGCMLVSSSYSFDADNNFVANVTASELSASNYVRKAIVSKSVTQDDSSDVARLKGDDLTWTSLGNGANATIGGAVLFNSSSEDTGSILIAFVDTNDLTTAGNDVTLDFDATNGILTIS